MYKIQMLKKKTILYNVIYYDDFFIIFLMRFWVSKKAEHIQRCFWVKNLQKKKKKNMIKFELMRVTWNIYY